MSEQDMKDLGGVKNMKIKDCVEKNKRVILFVQFALLKKFNHNKERKGWLFKESNEAIPSWTEYKEHGWKDRDTLYAYKWPNASSAEESFRKNTDGTCTSLAS